MSLYRPALQVLHATSPAAFVYVPGGHAVGNDAPAVGQWLPGGQSVQVRMAVPPGENLPEGHSICNKVQEGREVVGAKLGHYRVVDRYAAKGGGVQHATHSAPLTLFALRRTSGLQHTSTLARRSQTAVSREIHRLEDTARYRPYYTAIVDSQSDVCSRCRHVVVQAASNRTIRKIESPSKPGESAYIFHELCGASPKLPSPTPSHPTPPPLFELANINTDLTLASPPLLSQSSIGSQPCLNTAPMLPNPPILPLPNPTIRTEPRCSCGAN